MFEPHEQVTDTVAHSIVKRARLWDAFGLALIWSESDGKVITGAEQEEDAAAGQLTRSSLVT